MFANSYNPTVDSIVIGFSQGLISANERTLFNFVNWWYKCPSIIFFIV